MSALDLIPGELGVSGFWSEDHGSRLLSAPALEVRRMATVMTAHRARFVTITALPGAEEGGVRMSYHWDLDGQLLTIATCTRDNHMASIFDLCEAADWIEREIHECYAVEFEGRPHEHLLLRPGQAPGLGLRGEDE